MIKLQHISFFMFLLYGQIVIPSCSMILILPCVAYGGDSLCIFNVLIRTLTWQWAAATAFTSKDDTRSDGYVVLLIARDFCVLYQKD